ncbi:hypothetical protein BKA70DRAFT_1419698 [Coprinopsis sp. MPI-PUGE-AT-0042]|nr:hypothetical protein BKA70DRAFT_1419698 [Coprinopsis sp. MPI-PUGE-AT-0042]
MPTAVNSSSPAPTANKATASKPKPGQQARKKRVVRRRGRGPSGIGSDDEIEREAATDSDSDQDDDDNSSLDSATDDSDTEPASEDSPSRLESPPATTVVGVAGEMNGGVAPFFATSSTWSDMVADEAAHGAVGLPVVDFAEFDGQAKVPARRAKKHKQKKQQRQTITIAAAPAAEPIANEQDTQALADPTAPEDSKPANTGMRSDSMPRKLGQTARQAYQQRLEADPSYVPKVGGFWGHDDRLMDKDLRSLSGWWRGKWSGRGRGRGFGMRGGAHGGYEGHEFKSEDLPPVERQWTHDGFEEMKRKEEHRQPGRGRGGHRGGRGRGRGGFGPAPTARPPAPQPEVEVPWSRQSELSLFDDVKERGGKAAIRIKLPGKGGKIAHLKASSEVTKPVPAPKVVSSSSAPVELQYNVRLPKGKAKQQRKPLTETSGQSSSVPAAPPVEAIAPEVQVPSVHLPNPYPNSSIVSQLGQLSLEVTPSNPERQAKTEEAVMRKAGSVTSADGRPEADTVPSEQRPALPPLQTVFTPPPPPVAHQSPTFGSPYHLPQALPPGIALNQHGMPFEVATGRPVYLQPPQPMYNPQPMHYPSPGMYMHGPMHHPIASPDYLAQPPSHTPPANGFIDPSTGQPLFSLPRSVRIEIRAPGDARNPSSPQPVNLKPPTSSKLRTAATSFEPGRPNGDFNHVNRTPSESSSHPPSFETTNGGYENGHQAQQYPPMGNVMHYPGYQHQPYYYPEAYGYPGYMDMSQGQYDVYNPEQPQQGAVFY